MFQSASNISLDDRGRLSIPAKHRDALNRFADKRLTITRHPEGYLMIFPQANWESYRAIIADMPAMAGWWKRIILAAGGRYQYCDGKW